jgi:hypothetical protein
MQGQPYGGRLGVGPLHPVAAMGRDEEKVAGAQHPGSRFVLEAQPGAAGQKHHPLMGVLVVPLSRGRGLAGGDDALQAEMTGGKEDLENFLGDIRGDWGKQVGHGQTSLVRSKRLAQPPLISSPSLAWHRICPQAKRGTGGEQRSLITAEKSLVATGILPVRMHRLKTCASKV